MNIEYDLGALANDGMRIAPHLIREVRDAGGNVVYRAQPEQRRVISAETAIALRGMLEGVTLNGTAKKAQLDGYSAAGKTGTAQKIDPKTKTYSGTKFVGSFVGFAPVSNPQVVIIVVIDEPAGAYHGGDVADALGVVRAPTARLRHIAHLGVRTRDFAYIIRDATPPAEPFRVALTAPDGSEWTWGPEDAQQSVTGPALDFCSLVTQRVHRDDTALVATGSDADEWLGFAQAFAGPPGPGRAPGEAVP